MKSKTKQFGFTLVELLVVISIIGLLSTLAVVSLNSARSKARDARRVSDIKQIQTALELFYADQGKYPESPQPIEVGVPGQTDVLTDEGFESDPTGNVVYMGKVPANLENPEDIAEYEYSSENGQTYSLTFELEGDVAGLQGVLTATQDGVQ